MIASSVYLKQTDTLSLCVQVVGSKNGEQHILILDKVTSLAELMHTKQNMHMVYLYHKKVWKVCIHTKA